MSVKNSEKIKFRYPFLIRLFTIAATISAFLTPIYIIGNFVIQFLWYRLPSTLQDIMEVKPYFLVLLIAPHG
jgi:hypothetical protein